ncbi:autotransporter assembly complex protein TamA [Qipengyuania vesicularis]|uniref:autotransporter assembly complex protein TamA n=1 Tax=Qipengyuania vesicularis TaxID=2867232 RepID=UPI001FFD8C77|nr:BamA/TamA family outer membrane protein [Qipengyuania vesicularis]
MRLMVCAAALALIAPPLAAQDQNAPASLEDLIPDSAVENPESWAEQGAEPDETDIEVPDAEEPIPDPQGVDLPWPDDISIESFDPLEKEEDLEFAELDLGQSQVAFEEAETERIDDHLILGFPQTEPPFSARGDFVERFAALSTIESLEDEDANVAQLAARAREDEELLGNLLRVYGYYDGQVIRSIGAVQAGEVAADEAPVVRFDIIPGDRYTYGSIDLGNLDSAPDHTRLREAFGIQPGDFLQSDTIVAEQFNLDRALGENGYPFAAIDEPQLLIDHDRVEGDLTLNVEPNGKYVFGEVTSSDPKFLSGRHLGTIARFEPGDTYQRSLSLDLRRAVTATGLVSSVSVTPREVTPPSESEPGVVAMDVEVQRAKLRTIAGAIGYGSEEGYRLQASWEHRNLFPPEGSLRLRGIAGTQEQLAGITFRKNNFGGRDRVLTLDAYASTIDSPAFEARTIALTGIFERRSTLLFQKEISWSAGVELIATQERPPDVDGVAQPRQTFFVGALPGTLLLDETDDLLDPSRGFRLGARFSPEISTTNSVESAYLRARFDASYYQSLGDRLVLAGRAAFGSIPGAGLDQIAPSRRYYAGGGGSVRGYGFREIGPRDELGEPSGGRSLVEVAMEARIRTGLLDGAVSIVPFIDAGSVGPDPTPNFDEIKVGAGIGLRYHTGFGPIRIDVGTPLTPDEDDAPIAVYVSLGQAF